MLNRFCITVLLIFSAVMLCAQNVSTVAGSGTFGNTGDGGAATAAKFYGPYGVATDKAGNFYIADAYYQVVRKVTPTGIISTVAGNGTQGFSGDGGPATSAKLDTPYGLIVDTLGNLYIGDIGNYRIRKVTPGGTITTIAGTGTMAFSGDGGPATAANISQAYRLALDSKGALYFTDYMNARVRKISNTGIITTIAGNGSFGYSGDGGPATSAATDPPYGIAVDIEGNIFFSNQFTHYIRKVSGGIITTIAGTGTAGYSGNGGPATSASISYADGLKTDSCGNLYLAENGNSVVRKINSAGIISVVAGTGVAGYSGDGAAATAAKFQHPMDLAFDITGALLIADHDNHVIRKVTNVTKPAPKASISSKTDPKCYNSCDGKATATASGGMAPYTYNWNNNSTANPALTLCPDSNKLIVTDAIGCKTVAYAVLNNPFPVTVNSIRIVQPTCIQSNAEITIYASGGASPLIYSIDGGSSFQASNIYGNLALGTYPIVVRDNNGCETDTSITLSNQGGAVSITVNKQICSGDSMYLSGAWRKTSGTFKDSLLTAQGCDSVVTTNFTVKPLPVGQISGSTEICLGDSTTLTATGGTTYKWKSGELIPSITVKPSSNTSYQVVVTDANNCKDTVDFSIGINPVPLGNVSSSSAPTCPGSSDGSLTAAALAGTAPYSFSWNTTPIQTTATAINLSPGNYTCIITDTKGCKDTVSSFLGDRPKMDFVFSTTPTDCGASTGGVSVFSVHNGTGPYTYSMDGGAFQNSNIFASLPSGPHVLSVKNSLDCIGDTAFTINTSTGPSSFTANVTNAACGNANGIIEIRNIIGGSKPFTYQLNTQSPQPDSVFGALLAGNYTINLIDANGCNYSTSVTVNTSSKIDSILVNITEETCTGVGGSITVNKVFGGASPYSYAIDHITFNTTGTFSPLPHGCYTVTVKDMINACTYDTLICLDVQPGIDSVLVAITKSLCSKANGAAAITIYGGKAPFQTSFNNGTFSNQTNFANLSEATDSVIVKDADGCTTKKVFKIDNIKGPSDFDVALTPPGCSQNNGQIVVTTIIDGTAPYEYLYDSLGASYSFNNSFDNLYSGNHKLIARDANGCVLPFTVVLTNPGGPKSLVATIKAEDCGQNNGSIDITGTTGGTTPYDYRLGSGLFTGAKTFNNLDSGLYHIQIRDKHNCILDSLIKVPFNNGPVSMTIASTPSSCGKSNGILEITGETGGVSPYSYGIDGSIPSATKLFPLLPPGNHTLSVYDLGGCRKDSIVNLTNTSGPLDFLADVADDTCNKNTGMIKVQSVVAFASPLSFTIDANPVADADSTFTGVAVGTHLVTVTDANNCIFSKSFKIDPFNGPGPTGTNPPKAPHCSHNDGEISIIFNSVSGGIKPYSYTIGDTTKTDGSTFRGLVAGNYDLFVTDANGCKNKQTITLTDISGPTGFDTFINKSTCDKPNGRIQVLNVVGGSAPYSYSVDSIQFSSSNSLTGLYGGNYRVFVLDSFNCPFGLDVNVPSKGNPTIIGAHIEDEHCLLSDGEINDIKVNGGSSPYQFRLKGNGILINGNNFNQLSAATYLLEVFDSIGCYSTDTLIVQNLPGPKAEFTQSETSGDSPLNVIFSNLSTGVDNYWWDFGDKDTSIVSSPSHIYYVDGELAITLIAADKFGCTDTAFGSITINPVVSVYIPNTFTPDNDGFNETFSAVTYNIVSYTLIIYDRWGQEVAALSEKQPFWNGYFKSKPCPEAVYNFRFSGIDIKQQIINQIGTVNLIR